MEYFKDPKNQIYSSLAHRLGRIVYQYDKWVPVGEKFEATLYISVLQNLVTNCNEHIRRLTNGERRNSDFYKELSESIWGLDEECWIKNTFKERHTLQNFITRIRNSVSHPTHIDLKSEYPSSGFTTIEDDSGSIRKFRFINSPDTKNNKLKEYTLEAIKREMYGSGSAKSVNNELPDNISYELVPGKLDKYILVSNGKPFIRISIIDLTIGQLGSFVKALSNYLAQPIQQEWDGVTIKDLIAA